MKFDQYQIVDTLKDNINHLGFKKPTDIQFKAIPHILKGEDILAIAQTGTGKTAAFAIPTIDNVIKNKIKGRADGVKCLVMAPTHELAIQIEGVFKSLLKKTKLKSLCIHGGVDQDPQIASLNKGVDILVATPGRMFDLVSQGALKLHRVEILVLDEADHMLDLGFIKDIQDLIKHLPKKRQTLFFSATINERIKKLAYSIVSKPIRIQVSPKNPVAKNIEHAVGFIEMDDKRFFLENLINNHPDSKMLVFVRTKVRAERVKKAMERVDIVTDSIHSDKDQQERDKVMSAFRKGDLRILIATDVSARGIDIPNVDYVVNYDMPESLENYVHRVGRTGRGKLKGQALSFCSEQEMENLEEIEANLTEPIARLEINSSDYQYTLDISEDKAPSWQVLMKEAEQEQQSFTKKKKKKKK
ncbi:MAG: DEAD/DEAH box helicase [Fulvivirga sp.]